MLRGCEWVDRCRQSFPSPKKVHPHGKGEEWPRISGCGVGCMCCRTPALRAAGGARPGSGQAPREGSVRGSLRRRRFFPGAAGAR